MQAFDEVAAASTVVEGYERGSINSPEQLNWGKESQLDFAFTLTFRNQEVPPLHPLRRPSEKHGMRLISRCPPPLQDRDAYLQEAKHKEFVQRFKPFYKDMVVVDYEAEHSR